MLAWHRTKTLEWHISEFSDFPWSLKHSTILKFHRRELRTKCGKEPNTCQVDEQDSVWRLLKWLFSGGFLFGGMEARSAADWVTVLKQSFCCLIWQQLSQCVHVGALQIKLQQPAKTLFSLNFSFSFSITQIFSFHSLSSFLFLSPSPSYFMSIYLVFFIIPYTTFYISCQPSFCQHTFSLHLFWSLPSLRTLMEILSPSLTPFSFSRLYLTLLIRFKPLFPHSYSNNSFAISLFRSLHPSIYQRSLNYQPLFVVFFHILILHPSPPTGTFLSWNCGTFFKNFTPCLSTRETTWLQL